MGAKAKKGASAAKKKAVKGSSKGPSKGKAVPARTKPPAAPKATSPRAQPSPREKKVKTAGKKTAEEPAVRYEELEEGEFEPVTEEAETEEIIEEAEAEERALPAPVSARETAVLDTLSAYMREASRHPLLSREEEHELALRWYKKGDQEAALKLITSNLRLVVKIAWEYRSAHRILLDLVQEGNIGLMMAVRNFDPYKGVRLSSYAQYWIRAYMLRYIINNFHLVKLGTTQAQRKLFFNLRKEKEKLEREGFSPTTKLLAERLDVKESEVSEMDARLTGGEVSMDMPVGAGADDGGTTLANFIADKSEAVDNKIADEEQMARFHRALQEYRKTLEDRDQYIFDKRLVAEKPLTLEDIGKKYGVSKERARQLEERIKVNLRKFLDSRGHEFEI